MRIVKTLIIVIVAGVALLGIGGLFLPSTVGAERSVVIDRPASVVFTLLNSYARFNEWSPWAGMDPNATYSFSGPSEGVGASMAWSGNKDVGVGKQTITASEPYSRIAADLDFGPDGIAKAEFLLAPDGAGTRVTWRFETDLGANPFFRYFGLLIGDWVGADYERGLGKLKVLAEQQPNVDFANADIAIVELDAKPVLSIGTDSENNVAAIGAAYAAAYQQIGAEMAAQGLNQTGAVLGFEIDASAERYRFEAAIPVDRADATPSSPVVAATTPAGRAVRLRHVGSYDGLTQAEAQLSAFIATKAMKKRERLMLVYVSDPAVTPPAEVVTELYWPID